MEDTSLFISTVLSSILAFAIGAIIVVDIPNN